MNNRQLVILVLVVIATLKISSDEAFAYPADGYEPKDLFGAYSTGGVAYPPFWNIGDLQFMLTYPVPDSLTDSEKFIISGSKGSSYGHPLEAWKDLILDYVIAYEARTGIVPSEFSPDYFNAEMASEPLDNSQLAMFRNPITDEYPEFDATSFTPGGVYIRKLSQEEMETYAGISDHFDNIWFKNRVKYYGSDEFIPAKLTTPVFYVRIYGESDLIFTQLLYNYSVEE